MKLIVNGKEGAFNENLTVRRLLVEQQVKMPEMVSVEINGQILKRAEFEQRILEEGDKVEFLYFMGGGEKNEPQSHKVTKPNPPSTDKKLY